MTERPAYIIKYNDCYGNGDNKHYEAIVKSKRDFEIWLEQHNAKREADGNSPENKEEFTLIPINIVEF